MILAKAKRWFSRYRLFLVCFVMLLLVTIEFRMQLRDWRDARAEVLRSRQELEGTEVRLVKYKALSRQAGAGSPNIHVGLSVSDVVTQVFQASQRCGISELSYETKDREQQGSLEEKSLIFKVQGQWQGLLSFLEALQRPPLTLFMKSVFVTKSYDQNDVAMELVATFVRRKESADTDHGSRPPSKRAQR